ncbi:MAG: sulfatase-like hydrolase/transferase [Kordiimonadaceae bacterium]|nr:sulfatase-like hydrolase/transferase [Kordiimonadaceae bacterium]MBT6036363.1 sulfatase-like hydrolase/transferase [Kordiimonadaceae bacterium]
MKKNALFGLILLLVSCGEAPAPDKPNIIILYVDDLGYGDIGVNGATAVQTPNIDRLAAGGLNFTDAHSTAATCTPSRYALLTGEHGFRSNLDIVDGDASALIRPGKPTLPSMLKKAGYSTAVIGKWHLGLGDGVVDWNKEVKPGPREIGFDYSFLMPSTGDRVPSVYLENHTIIGLDPNDPIAVSYGEKVGSRPTGRERPDLLRYQADDQHSDTIINGVSRIGTMAGGEAALWLDEEFVDIFTGKARDFIRGNKDDPFFLFYSFHDIHVPRLPNPRFIGKTDMGPRGDAIAQMDWVVGEITAELEMLGLAENTLILFTSDNGPVLNDGYSDQAVERLGNHKPAGIYKGGKYSAFEAGTRMPTIIHWPGTVDAGVSEALISQVDLYASLAAMLGVEIADGEAVDSLNVVDALLGRSETARDYIIEESVVTLSLRKGNWKYIAPTSPQGNERAQWVAIDKAIEGGFTAQAQLYNLAEDPTEQNNIANDHPELVQEMSQKLAELRISGFRN